MKNIWACFLRLRAVLVLGCAAIVPSTVLAAAGDLYIEDDIGGTIFRLTPDGTKTTFVTGLANPRALAFDTAGNLFVADHNSVLKFAPDGTQSTFVSGLQSPLGLAFDSSGNLFVSDTDTIFKFGRDGTKNVFASGLNQPVGLAFDHKGNLFEADFGSNTIFKFSADGATKTPFASLPSTDLLGLAFDAKGNLFVGDGNFGDIFKIAPDGSRSTVALNLFSSPFGLAFNDKGELFVSAQRTIVKFAADGTRNTFSSGYDLARFIAFEPLPRQLQNVSARGFVDSGDKVVIGGFIIGGSALSNNAVVVRGIGPSLPRADHLNSLQDPILELHDASGAIIAANDNWQDTQKAQIIATGLAPSDPRESAIFATLPAGNYTAVVRGINDTAGTALVEVYNVR